MSPDAGQPNTKATPPECLTLMRGGSVAEHFRLGMADAGFPLHIAGDLT